ncbi:MAG: rod shape-determining protein MreD [Elusimicrobia bacterium]|nr:rod shape-determining protein MreD [Elusimicrobiota bacterium]MDE2314223.1 rod shape-determining protein MreD [Elusimicrobiota bacterium]
MKALRAIARASGLFLGAALLQWLWSSHFAPYGLAPQLLLVLTVSEASRRGAPSAMALGFFWGLFLDSMGVRLFGANALALVLLAYAAGLVRHQMDSGEAAPQAVISIVASWGYFLFLGLVSWIFTQRFSWIGWTGFVVLPFYNGLLAAALAILRPRRRAW